MTLNEKKKFNYKVLDLVIFQNIDIKYDFIRDHMKKLWIFLCETIYRGGSCHHPPLKMHLYEQVRPWPVPTNATIFRGGSWRHPPLEMLFLGAGDAMNDFWKWGSFLGVGEEWPAPKNVYSNPINNGWNFGPSLKKNRSVPTNCFL